MFAPFIDNNLPFIKEYFELLCNSSGGAFPQSIIFYGEDVLAQYMLALNLSKILNCSDDRSAHCACLNCNWIRENNHPAVTTVSKVDFKPDNDNSKTVISVKQTQEIKNLLSTTSEYHRFFIICDAEIKVPNAEELAHVKEFKLNKFALPFDDEPEFGGQCWIPKGLTRAVFQEESANSLLKSIEEPPPKTTFIFLTKDKSDLIETIISRSQSFFVPSVHVQDTDIKLISEELKYYPEIDRLEINIIAENLLTKGVEQNLTPDEIFTKFQQFIKNTALANTSNPQNVAKMLEDIRVLNEAQAQIKSYVKPQIALENAIYRIYKNWEK